MSKLPKPTASNLQGNLLGIDFGDVRIGLARVNTFARLPEPLVTVAVVDGAEYREIAKVISDEAIVAFIVGLPRGMSGQETAQTDRVQEQAAQLEQFGLPIYWQDESLTSVHAESQLADWRKRYDFADSDNVAATLILEDFIRENF